MVQQRERGGPWTILGLVMVGTFMTTLDTSIVNISLPAIARAFGTPLSGAVEWVLIIYLVVIAALLLVFGRLSDTLGRKPVWVAGLVVFTLGSACCGFAPNLPLLIAARAFQGIGGALIFAPSVALITDAFPPEQRGRGIGLNAVAVSFGVAAGPGWTSPALLGSLAVAFGSLALLPVIERRVTDPNLDLKLLTCRPFVAAVASLVLSFLGLFAVGFLMPFYFENLRGFSPELSGFLLTPFALTIALAAPISGTLADRIGSRWLASAGLAIASVGLFLVSLLNADSSPPDIIWRLALIGIGIGMFQSPNNRALMQAAPSSEQGEASGILGTGRVIGQSLSVAVAGAVFAALGGMGANTALQAAAQQGQTLPPEQLAQLQQQFLAGFHAAMLTCGAIAAIGIVTSLERSGSEACHEEEEPVPALRGR